MYSAQDKVLSQDCAAMVRILVKEKGAALEAKFGKATRTALIDAASLEPAEYGVSALLALGASVNAQDQDGFTALHVAARAGKHSCFVALLDHGADINQRTLSSGNTALHLGCLNGQTAIVRECCKRGCDLSVKNQSGKIAMDVAREENEFDCVAILKSPPAPVAAAKKASTATVAGPAPPSNDALLFLAVSNKKGPIVGSRGNELRIPMHGAVTCADVLSLLPLPAPPVGKAFVLKSDPADSAPALPSSSLVQEHVRSWPGRLFCALSDDVSSKAALEDF
jgi:ankyrin repeat protein